jgi:hypothetical protein
MNAFETLLPLAAFASPVLALAALNLYLALDGERGTLLLPSFGSRRPAFGPRAESVLPASFTRGPSRSPANDPDFRRAA